MSQRLRSLVRRAEQHLQDQETHRRFLAQVRESEIMDLIDAPPEEMIALCRTIHSLHGTADQNQVYEAAVDHLSGLLAHAERRWEAKERPGPVGFCSLGARHALQILQSQSRQGRSSQGDGLPQLPE